MAERRMFAKSVIDSDSFLDMPLTTQALYFHLAMRADDDGFVNNPKRIQRMIGCSDDEMKVLTAKQYIIPFESGIVVIRHWKIHNYIQKDRYHPSAAVEKNMVSLDSSKTYNLLPMDTGCIQDVYNTDTESVQNGNIGKVRLGKVRLGKVRLGKVRLGKTTTADVVDAPVDNSNLLADKRFGKICELYQDCVQPIPNAVIVDDLSDLYNEYGYEWMIEAIKETARNRARSIKYVASILNNWSQRGVKDPWNHPKKTLTENSSQGLREIDIAAEAIAMLNSEKG